MRKGMIWALVLLLVLGGCASPEQKEGPDGRVMDCLYFEKMGDQETYYIASESGDALFKEQNYEGTVEFNQAKDEVRVDITLSVGQSCSGDLEGHGIEYTANLRTQEISDFQFEEWKGCDGKRTYPLQLTDEEMLQFASDLYTTIHKKEK